MGMEWWNGGSTNITANVPLVWDSEHLIPALAKKGNVRGRADFDRMPLQAVLAWMAGVVNVEGILEGSVTAQGRAQDPKFVGSVVLSDGRINLRSVGQTLEDVTGRAIFDEDEPLLYLPAVDRDPSDPRRRVGCRPGMAKPGQAQRLQRCRGRGHGVTPF